MRTSERWGMPGASHNGCQARHSPRGIKKHAGAACNASQIHAIALLSPGMRRAYPYGMQRPRNPEPARPGALPPPSELGCHHMPSNNNTSLRKNPADRAQAH